MRSTNSFSSTSLKGNSVFSLAVDPVDADHIVCGTAGGGLYVTTDQGVTWTRSDDGLVASDSLGFAGDAGDPLHLIVSSTEALDQTPGSYETFDSGATWTQVAALDVDVLAFDIDPTNPSIMLAGTFSANPGIVRTTTGSGGSWSPVLTTTVAVPRRGCAGRHSFRMRVVRPRRSCYAPGRHEHR